MGTDDIQRALLTKHGLRITPAMSEYILSKLKSSHEGELPIIAGDAKTGIPVRALIPIDTLANFATTPQP